MSYSKLHKSTALCAQQQLQQYAGTEVGCSCSSQASAVYIAVCSCRSWQYHSWECTATSGSAHNKPLPVASAAALHQCYLQMHEDVS